MEPNTPEAWFAAPGLVVAGLVVLLNRKRLTALNVRNHEWLREKVSILPKHEPAWLRPLVPIVGVLWTLAGLALLILLLVQ